MTQNTFFSKSLERKKITNVYNNWLIANKPLYAKYYSLVSLLFMAILLPFDFLLFENALFYVRFRVLFIIIIAINAFLLRIRNSKTEQKNRDSFDILLLIPALLFCLVYEYFLFRSYGFAYKTVLIANYMAIFFTTLFLHKIWKEQYVLNIISMVGFIVIGFLRNDIIMDLILITIFLIATNIMSFFFRREFVGSMYLRRSRQKLQMAKERAEAADQLKNVFLSTMSHEIRTPLNVIFGFIELLQINYADKLSKEEKKFFKVIKQGKERLLRLVDEILDISQIESGNFLLKSQNIQADEIVKQCLMEISISSKKKKLKIIENFQASSAVLFVDKARFEQIVANILDNAVKYTNKGSITISTRIDNNEYTLAVSDTGIGIREDFKPHIFTAFRQGEEGINRSYEGAGLGLAIVYDLVTQMNGKIKFESKEGAGSTFYIRFPIEGTLIVSNFPEDEYDSIEEETSEKLSSVEVKPNDIKLLVIEDNISNRLYIEYLLKKMNYDFISVDSGPKALDVLNREKISGMLVDISLSDEMDGIEFLKQARATDTYKKVPAIAVTAHTMKGMRKEFLEQGFTDYLSKPFTIKLLKKVLAKNFSQTTPT